ncbi:MAG: HD-GYP domain-containing protein, partial [Clostridiales bacterium]|nr:HD-GYP domain-containing protein [Clostridiales bacterium]
SAAAQVRIHIDELRPNMIVAKDVIASNGVLLVARDTMLNHVSYTKLKINKIKAVSIKAFSIDYETPTFLEDEANESKRVSEVMRRDPNVPPVPVADTQKFHDFAEDYEKSLATVHEDIESVVDGADIDVEKFFESTNSVMKKLQFKTDVFPYLNAMQDGSDQIFGHCANVALLANLFGSWLNMDEHTLANLVTAGMLHDIGKLKVPKEILDKPGHLTETEMAEARNHAVYGYRILENKQVALEVKQTALMHHERLDGSGYPVGAKGDKIKYFAKIISICDIYDAMTSDRPYRKKICPFEVIRQFEQSSFASIDTELLLIFLQNISYTYISSRVRLSDDRLGEVTFINRNHLSRPTIFVDDGEVVDLIRDKNIDVAEIF